MAVYAVERKTIDYGLYACVYISRMPACRHYVQNNIRRGHNNLCPMYVYITSFSTIIYLTPGLLATEENLLYIGYTGEITLECSLAGYVEELTINEYLIDWTFNGQPLTTDSNYIISVASRECPPYGICGLGLLRIVDVGSDDLGDYVCSFGNLSQNITLLEGGLVICQLQ